VVSWLRAGRGGSPARFFPVQQFNAHPKFERARRQGAGETALVSSEPVPGSKLLPPTLVIGYGSTLRGDDAVGPEVADRVGARQLDGVQVVTCHQLTPELSDPISRVQRVIFIDASLDLPDGTVRVSRVFPEASHQVMVHTASPAGLLHLARSVFAACPTAWIVEVPVAEMGIGEQLSPVARRGVEEAVDRVLDLLTSDRPE